MMNHKSIEEEDPSYSFDSHYHSNYLYYNYYYRYCFHLEESM